MSKKNSYIIVCCLCVGWSSIMASDPAAAGYPHRPEGSYLQSCRDCTVGKSGGGGFWSVTCNCAPPGFVYPQVYSISFQKDKEPCRVKFENKQLMCE